MKSNIQQYNPLFYTFYESHFSLVRHPSHPSGGHGSLTCHRTQFERSDWLRSENFINIMIEYINKYYIYVMKTYILSTKWYLLTNPFGVVLSNGGLTNRWQVVNPLHHTSRWRLYVKLLLLSMSVYQSLHGLQDDQLTGMYRTPSVLYDSFHDLRLTVSTIAL